MHQYTPVTGQIMTRWADKVNSNNPYPQYPRPQMKRREWRSLNGLWEYSVTSSMDLIPSKYEGEILVPFCIESALSGVKKGIKPTDILWYHRMFSIPLEWHGNRIKINFGAIDWYCIVYVNRVKVGDHKGGYSSFSLDITSYVKWDTHNEIDISVYDPTNKGSQPRGKQILKPWAAFYTAVSGIWQSVWLEPVPNLYIDHVKITPHFDTEEIELSISEIDTRYELKNRPISLSITQMICEVFDNGHLILSSSSQSMDSLKIRIPDPKMWSPQSPHLYDLKISLAIGNTRIDTIESYFGLRKVEVKKDEEGIPKIFLNNEEIFQLGVLDQGYFPDGLYTAPTAEALFYDVNVAKEIGLNMIRKHVKIEPDIWYHYCDKLGIIVWQDMPNAGNILRGSLSQILFGSKWVWETRTLKKNNEVIAQFEWELHQMVDQLYNHPAVISITIFNEGWGQHHTVELTKKVKEWDSTRLINSASGWVDMKVGDMHDIHKYPGPMIPELELKRVAVNGEFGGLGLKVLNHTWIGPRYWAYRTYNTQSELEKAYAELIENLIRLRNKGLTAAIYTQITDVEQEINGFLTYDRKIWKFSKDFLHKINSQVYY